MVAVLLAATSVLAMARPQPALAWDGGAFSSASEAELVALTNRDRATAGLKGLTISNALGTVARWRSQDMVERNYFSHDIPGFGGQVFKRLDADAYCYKMAGENIGWNNYPDDVATTAIQQMFMDSPGHRANILGEAWAVIGIGAYKAPDGRKMWTILFADRAGCGEAAPTTPAPTMQPTDGLGPVSTVEPTQAPDVRRPTIVGRTPAVGAAGIDRERSIKVRFSEPVTGVSRATVRLVRISTGRVVTTTVSYNSTTRTATINPTGRLAARTAYRVQVRVGVADRAGNTVVPTSWRFLTK